MDTYTDDRTQAVRAVLGIAAGRSCASAFTRPIAWAMSSIVDVYSWQTCDRRTLGSLEPLVCVRGIGPVEVARGSSSVGQVAIETLVWETSTSVADMLAIVNDVEVRVQRKSETQCRVHLTGAYSAMQYRVVVASLCFISFVIYHFCAAPTRASTRRELTVHSKLSAAAYATQAWN